MPTLFFKRALKLVHWTLTLRLLRRLRERRLARVLRDSGLFDVAFYLSSHPDVAESDLDPVTHYVRYGAAEGRNPNPLFDTRYYVSSRSDVKESGMNPLLHYLIHGAQEGLNPHLLFDTAYYAAQVGDEFGPQTNALQHYLEIGAAAGLRTNSLFDPSWYRQVHPEVDSAGLDPLGHYLTHSRPLTTNAPATIAASDQDSNTRLASFAAAGDATGEPAQLIAFFLPQYHPIPENDEWWGDGFTDWTNVKRGEPLYAGHHQPRLPADLGFYDLRAPEVRRRQAELASDHGIDGFCYYYYWFEGRRVLERPLAEIAESGEPDFPFCICWANENWTRRWDGLESEILIEQNHSLAADMRFIEDVLPLLKDPRYITVDGAPLLLIYRADMLKDPQETAALWRDVCTRAGLPGVHLCAVQFRVTDPRPLGFDSAVEFPPHHFPAPRCSPTELGAISDFEGTILDYRTGAANALLRADPDYVLYRGIVPSWDNTARRQKAAMIYHGSTPAAYESWLDGLIRNSIQSPSPSSRFIFINAWNEWAEGAYLEPDRLHGRAYLQATKRATERYSSSANKHVTNFEELTTEAPARPSSAKSGQAENPTPLLFVAHDAAAAGSQFVLLELLEALNARGGFELHVALLGGGDLLPRYQSVAHTLRLESAGHAAPLWLSDYAEELRAQGCTVAICNTVVTSEAADLCKRAGLGVLSLVHEQPDSIDSMFGGAATINRLERCSDAIVTVSRFASDAISQRYDIPDAKITVIHPPLRTLPASADAPQLELAEWFGASPTDTLKPFVVLGCGTLYPRKGPDLFIELARRLKSEAGSERFRFLWVGGAMTEHGVQDHQQKAEEANVSDVLCFTGTRDDIAGFLRLADVFALTSREDPFPLINLEAMSFGLPTLAFAETGGAPEIIGDDAGVVVPHLDVRAMTKTLLELESDRERLNGLGARAREKISTEFSPDHYAEQVIKLLDRVRSCVSQ